MCAACAVFYAVVVGFAGHIKFTLCHAKGGVAEQRVFLVFLNLRISSSSSLTTCVLGSSNKLAFFYFEQYLPMRFKNKEVRVDHHRG